MMRGWCTIYFNIILNYSENKICCYLELQYFLMGVLKTFNVSDIWKTHLHNHMGCANNIIDSIHKEKLTNICLLMVLKT